MDELVLKIPLTDVFFFFFCLIFGDILMYIVSKRRITGKTFS